MIFKLRVENVKDETGVEKRAMFITLDSQMEPYGVLNAVAELPEKSPLAKEVDFLINDMMSQKKAHIKSVNSSKLKNKLGKVKK